MAFGNLYLELLGLTIGIKVFFERDPQ